MVLISVKNHWYIPKEKIWTKTPDYSKFISSSRRFKTLKAARRNLTYLLIKYPANEITFWYRNKKRTAYEWVYPVTKTANILYGKNNGA